MLIKAALGLLLFGTVLHYGMSAMNDKQVKAAGKLVRNACQPKMKATDEMIDNMHKGVWAGDPIEKVLTSEFLVVASKKTGELDMESIMPQIPTLPEYRQEITKNTLEKCKSEEVVSDDKCDNAWRISKCIYEDNPTNCLALAIYDNIAESQDELQFRKNDLLVVLEQNTANMEGWWLCSLRGRQGICPGNRLRLIPGVYEDVDRAPSPQFSTHSLNLTSMTYANNEINCLQRQGKRRSWHVQPNKVITPRRYNDVYLYDMPPSRNSPIPVHTPSPSQHHQTSDYDVPPKAVPVGYDNRNCLRCSPAPSCISPVSKDSQDSYDIPRLLHSQNMLTPSSSASSLSLTGESFSSSNRSSLINMPEYDVPRPLSKGPQLVLHAQQQQPVYDVPSSSQHQIKELPLEITQALDTLERLQNEATSVISRLLSFVTTDWRTPEKLEANILEIKLVVIRLKTSLHDFSEFCEGALGNATRATDKNLSTKLLTLVIALRNADKLIQEAADKLTCQNWDVHALCRLDDYDKYKPDELEQIIACTRSLTEDIRQAASFIQGNSTLLFKRDSVPSTQPNCNQQQEDYDYVNLETKEAYAKANAEIRNELPSDLRKNYDRMVKNVEDVVLSKDVTSDDKQILTFYAHQTTTHHNNLTQAIDAFLQTVEHNQPPKIFLAHGKFVVLSAHKLVHIGDTVSRGVTSPDIKCRTLNCANALSEALATSVSKTKQAALQFPSVTAVQEMVDSIVDISHLAKDLKMCLMQAAQP